MAAVNRAALLLLFWIPVQTVAATYQQAYERMAADPANPQKSFNFVKAAVREGDLTGAVGALERILRINPSLANIQLELGVLYLRLGAPGPAAEYMQSAMRSPEVPVWVRNRAKSMLAHATQANKRHQFAFAVTATSAHDSNANGAPTDPEVRVGGGFGVLDEDDTGRSDLSWGVLTSGQYTYAFNSEAGHQLELSFGSFNKRYDRSDELDLDSLRVDVGPRFYFGPVFNPSYSLKPYLLASRLDLDSDKYLESAGAGLNLRRLFSPVLKGDIYLEYRDQDYSDSARRLAADRSGEQFDVRGQLSYLIDPTRILFVEAAYGERDAEVDWESRELYGLRLAYTQLFSRQDRKRPARITLSVGGERLDYDLGDPAIAADTPREDDRLRAALALGLPLAQRTDLILTTSYTDVDSSLPNFEYDNWGGSVSFRFAY